MKLLVLGATGGIGIEIVEQALERGHSVTAFVRASQRLKALVGKIKVVEGNLLDGRELARVLEGHDAVISGFGPRVPIAKADAHLLRDFAAALTNAMRRAVVPRAIVVSTAFLFKDSLIPPVYLLGRLLFPGRGQRRHGYGEDSARERARHHHRATASVDRQALYGEVSRARRPSAELWVLDLARGCSRFHDSCRRRQVLFSGRSWCMQLRQRSSQFARRCELAPLHCSRIAVTGSTRMARCAGR